MLNWNSGKKGLAVATQLLLLFAVLLLTTPAASAARGQSAGEKSADQSEDDNSESRVRRPTARERAAARRAAREQAAKEKQESERRKWLARLEARGVEPWPEEQSEEEHAKALAKSREMVDEVLSVFPGTELFETEHFLFTTNMPAEQARPYIAALDRMYGSMGRLYGDERGKNVWYGGKSPIDAFL
jgi:hypothetical protein